MNTFRKNKKTTTTEYNLNEYIYLTSNKIKSVGNSSQNLNNSNKTIKTVYQDQYLIHNMLQEVNYTKQMSKASYEIFKRK